MNKSSIHFQFGFQKISNLLIKHFETNGFTFSLWVPVSLSLIAIFFTSLTSYLHGQEMSMIDEWMYLDYSNSFWNHGLFYPGDLLSQLSLQRMACYGEVPFGPMGEACETPIGHFTNSAFPMGGINSANLYTPLTFLPQLTFGQIPLIFGATGTFFWRLCSLFWLIPTLWLIYLSGRQFGASNLSLLMVGSLFLGSPFSYWTYSYVNTDAPVVFFGALCVYLYLLWKDDPKRNFWFIPLSGAGILIKETAIIPILLIASLLLIRAWQSRKIMAKSLALIVSAIGSIISAITIAIFWHKIQSINLSSHFDNIVTLSTPGIREINRLISNFSFRILDFSVLIPDGVPTDAIPFPGFVTVLFPLLLAGGVIGALLISPQNKEVQLFSVAVFVFCISTGPILAFMLFISGTSYFELPTRYASGMLVPMLLMLAIVSRRKLLIYVFTIYGLGLLALQPLISWLIAIR